SPLSDGYLFTLFFFGLVAVAWAPVCAAFLASAVADPSGRIGAVIEQIIRQGDIERLERIPIFFRDEIGRLAEGVNEMVERLESSARFRRYSAERERLLDMAARRAAQLQAVLDNL